MQPPPRMRSVLFFAGDSNEEDVGRQHIIIKKLEFYQKFVFTLVKELWDFLRVSPGWAVEHQQ